ncbi:hypothetical protein EVAR_66416_1 [Eumeta japonica]|uniref:Uncharacterized protein n=1 Tax=Eumeta variegata TaxID=151549 RepID=A0A4C2A598_EUMVA|nr:hypothetical protein EVAR_66416_1 [Eumeta japonica]
MPGSPLSLSAAAERGQWRLTRRAAYPSCTHRHWFLACPLLRPPPTRSLWYLLSYAAYAWHTRCHYLLLSKSPLLTAPLVPGAPTPVAAVNEPKVRSAIATRLTHIAVVLWYPRREVKEDKKSTGQRGRGLPLEKLWDLGPKTAKSSFESPLDVHLTLVKKLGRKQKQVHKGDALNITCAPRPLLAKLEEKNFSEREKQRERAPARREGKRNYKTSSLLAESCLMWNSYFITAALGFRDLTSEFYPSRRIAKVAARRAPSRTFDGRTIKSSLVTIIIAGEADDF